MKKSGVLRLLAMLTAVFLAFGVYAVCIHLWFNAIFWIYVGLCAGSAAGYVLATRGNLSPLPETTPTGQDPTLYRALRERVEAARRRVFFLPYIAVGTGASLLLDAVNLFLFDGKFL